MVYVTPPPTPQIIYVTPAPVPTLAATPAPTISQTPPDTWMKPVCAAWGDLRSKYTANVLADVVDSLNAGDMGDAASQVHELNQAAADAQSVLRDAPEWSKDGTEYVGRLRTEAAAARKFAVAAEQVFMTYPYGSATYVSAMIAAGTRYETAWNSTDRMEKVMSDRHQFDCPAWLSKPVATPLAGPAASRPFGGADASGRISGVPA